MIRLAGGGVFSCVAEKMGPTQALSWGEGVLHPVQLAEGVPVWVGPTVPISTVKTANSPKQHVRFPTVIVTPLVQFVCTRHC